MRELGLGRHPGGHVLRDNGALEDPGRQVDRDARVRYVDDASNPALYRGRPDYDVGLLVRIAARLEVTDGVQTGLPVSDCEVHIVLAIVLAYRDALEDEVAGVPGLEAAQLENWHVRGAIHGVLLHAALDQLDTEVYVSGHLDGPAEGDLAVPLREVQVPHRELGALDVHREVDARPDREVFDVDVTAMLARRNRPAGLPGHPVKPATAQRSQERVLLERGKGQRRHPIGVRLDEGLLPPVPPGKQIVGRGAADEPRVPDTHELHVRYVARGRVQTAKVPDRLVGLRVDIREKAATVLLGEDAGVAPLISGSGGGSHVEDVHDQQVARLSAVDVDRPAQNVAGREVYIADVVCGIVVPDLQVGPIQALDPRVCAGVCRGRCRDVWVPGVVSGHLLILHGFVHVNLE